MDSLLIQTSSSSNQNDVKKDVDESSSSKTSKTEDADKDVDKKWISPIAIVCQQMISSEISGICFTADVTNSNRFIITFFAFFNQKNSHFCIFLKKETKSALMLHMV